VLLAGCHVPGFDTPRPASTQGNQASRVWNDTEVVALVVGAVVWALIAFTVIRFRRRHPGGDPPSQRAESIPLEILYTATPLLIVGCLFAFTTISQDKINAVSAHPDVRVEAVAFQWGWQFTYPGSGVSVATSDNGPPTLVLPLGETTEVRLTATDVVHAFYVANFLFQRAAVPGSPTTFDVTPTRLGVFSGKCSTYCGIKHYAMTFTVRVVSPGDFEQWLQTPR
jgi:cytochrome c oxidase subunit 2